MRVKNIVNRVKYPIMGYQVEREPDVDGFSFSVFFNSEGPLSVSRLRSQLPLSQAQMDSFFDPDIMINKGMVWVDKIVTQVAGKIHKVTSAEWYWEKQPDGHYSLVKGFPPQLARDNSSVRDHLIAHFMEGEDKYTLFVFNVIPTRIY